MLIPPYVLEFVVKKSRNMCAMTGLNIFPLNVWEEGVRRTGEGVVGCQSKVQHEIDCHPELVSGAHLMKQQVKHNANFLKRTYSHIHLFTYSLHKKAAFTLAEVLITLGIIGVVAAMTMPSLIQNYKYMVLENQLKTAYSDLNQAAKMFQLHNGLSMSDYASNVSAQDALKAFLKEFKAVLKYNSLTEGQKDDEGNTILASPYNLYTIDGSTLVKSTCDRSGFIWDTQGRTISFDDTPQAGKNGPKVCIDINGEKAPNRYGVDYFVFMFTTDGYVIPWGQVHKDNPDCTNVAGNCTIPFDSCKYTSNTPDSYSCANYALINQHPTDSGKDYWHDFVRGR